MRVVLDTNILISACLKQDGLEARTLALVAESWLTACVSAATLQEYREVLSRPKFAAHRIQMTAVLEMLEAKALVVKPVETLQVAADDDDNRFLECAATAQAEYLITGNLRDYPTVFRAPLQMVRVVNAREFLNTISPPPNVVLIPR